MSSPGIYGKWFGLWIELIKIEKNRQGKGAVLGSLVAQLAMVLLATLVAGVACGLVALAFIGRLGFWLALAAAGVSLPVGAVVVVYFYRHGLSAEAIVVGTLLRVFLTAALAGGLSWVVLDLRSSVFFLSLGVVYLANLMVETSFALRLNQSPRRCEPTV